MTRNSANDSSDARATAFGPFARRAHDHRACVAEALAAAQEICARRKRRLTALRRRVLELVWGRHQPVGAYDILEALRRERGTAAPASVYRALDFLLANGLVHRIESLNAFVGCGAPRRPHAGQFLICRHCRTVAELDDAEIARALSLSAARAGLAVDRQTVELAGLCVRCRDAGMETAHAGRS